MLASSAADERTPLKMSDAGSVAAWVEEIGYGPGQLCIGTFVNGVWLADGAEGLIIAAVTCMVQNQWHLEPTQSGALSSVVYLGTLIGSLLSGRFGDAAGRRPPIIVSYPVIILFSLLSASSPNFGWLMFFRLGVGLGFGIGQPCAVTTLVEVTPIAWRAVNQGMAQVAYAVGEMIMCFAMWVEDTYYDGNNWRWLLRVGAIPALFFWILSVRFLVESPAFVAQGSPAAAEEGLRYIARMNGKGDLPITVHVPHTWPAELSLHRQLQIVLGPHMLANTMLLSFVALSYNLVVYGCFFAFPQVLPDVGLGVQPVSAALALGALVEIPFDIVGMILGVVLRRRTALAVYFVGLTVSTMLFVSNSGGQAEDRSWTASTLLHLGFFGLKGFPQIGSTVLYIYASEIYPVAARVGGTAVVLGFGRAGAIASSVVYEMMYEAFGSFHQFFHLAVILTLVSMLAVWMMTDEAPEMGSAYSDIPYESRA